MLLFVSCNRVYTLIHVLAYRSTEKDYEEKDAVSSLFYLIHNWVFYQVCVSIQYGPKQLIILFLFECCKNNKNV